MCRLFGMSKFTDLRDSATQNVTLALTQMLFGYVKEKIVGRARSSSLEPLEPPPCIVGDSDSSTGAGSGSTEGTDGSTGHPDERTGNSG